MKDDRDPYYIEKERKNSEMIPYIAGMFLIAFVVFVLATVVQLVMIL